MTQRSLIVLLLALAGCGDGGSDPALPPVANDTAVSPPDTSSDTTTLPPLAPGSATDPLIRTATVAVGGVQMHPAALAVAEGGLVAYCDGDRVTIVTDDLKPPAAPASNTLSGACLAVAFDGPYGFASVKGGKWVSVTSAGTFTPTVIDGPDANALALTPERIYAAAGTLGLASALRDDAKATVHGVAKDARDVLVLGDDLIVADGRYGLARMTLGADGMPSIKAQVEPIDVDWAVAPLDDTHVLAARGAAGIAILDASAGGLKVTSTYDTTSMATDVAAGPNGLVMVADWTAARLVDLSAPDAPALVAGEAFPRTASGLGRAVGVAYAGGAFQVLGLDHLTRLAANPAVVVPELEVLREQVLAEVVKCDGTDPDCTETSSAGVLLRNRGRTALEVKKIAVSDPRLTLHVDPSPVPGVDMVISTEDPSGFFEIAIEGLTPLDASLTFETNDPDHADVTIPIRVNPPLAKVGDKAADFLFPGIDGSAYQLSALGGKVIFMKVFNSL